MTTHSRLSPSSRHRWSVCPGSVREEAKYPERPSGPAAIDGTHSHTLLETCLKESKFADEYIGKELKDHEGSFVVDAQRAERVQVALDYVNKRITEINQDKIIVSNAVVKTEQRVDPKVITGRDDLSGTVDIQIIGGTVYEIIDYKDGMQRVDAMGNLQLEQYAIGAISDILIDFKEYRATGKLQDWVSDYYDFTTVRMTIIQPKLALRGLPPITSWDVKVADIAKASGTLINQAAATDDPNAPLVPGESQCKYCRASGSCSAKANAALEASGITFHPIVENNLDVVQQAASKDPATLDNAQLVRLVEAAPLLRQMIEGAEEEALRRMKAGQDLQGLKLVNGKGSRKWTFSEDEMAQKLVKMGIPKSAIYETKLVSPAKAEKLTWSKKDGSTVQLTERQLKRLETEYITKLTGKLTVAPESDSRQAVVTNAAPMFSAVEVAPAAVSLPSWLI